jgi:hypothetical protein
MTDKDGQFEFADVPAECLFTFWPKIAGYVGTDFRIFAATTNRKLPQMSDKWVIHTGEVNVTFTRTFEFPVKVVYGDTGLPAPQVYTAFEGGSGTETKETDANGIATLHIAPGTYRQQWLSPARGSPYLYTELSDEIVITKELRKEPFVLKLKPACVIDVTIVDAETGKPISDVDLWMNVGDAKRGDNRSEVMFRSWEKPIFHVDRPKSDKDGKLRILVEPGEHRFGVGFRFFPEGYEREPNSQLLDCPASQTITATFKLTRLAKREPPTEENK